MTVAGEVPIANKLSVASRWDWPIAVAFIGLGVLGLRAVSDPVMWERLSSRARSGQTVGWLARQSGGVRFRAGDSPIWHDLSTGTAEVAEGDTVFTAEDGRAELKLGEGATAEIEPGSLVVVHREAAPEGGASGWLKLALGEPRAPTLKIERGSATVRVQKGQADVNLEVQNKVYRVSARSQGAPGVLSVDAAARFESTTAGQVALSDAQGAPLAVESPKIVMISPKNGERLMPAPDSLVEFSWRWESSGDAAGATLALESVTGQPPQAFAIDAGRTSAQLKLDPGMYRWRIATSAISSPWQGFSLAWLAPPAPLGPIDGARIHLGEGASETPVLFSWQRPPAGLQAELEWRPAPPQPAPWVDAGSLMGEGTPASQSRFAAGSYEWRVRASATGAAPGAQPSRASAWSAPRRFEVVAAAPPEPLIAAVVPPPPVSVAPVAAPAPPVVAAAPVKHQAPPAVKKKPARVLRISIASGSTRLGKSEQLDQLTLPLDWAPIDGATEYQVRVMNARTGAQILSEKTSKPRIDWVLHRLDTTHFKYQVTALFDDGDHVTSPPIPLEIRLSPPVPNTPRDGASVERDELGTTLLTWERTIFTESYRVQYSREPHFRDADSLTRRAAHNLFSLPGLLIGVQYYWRVQAVAHGEASPWSEPRSFKIVK